MGEPIDIAWTRRDWDLGRKLVDATQEAYERGETTFITSGGKILAKISPASDDDTLTEITAQAAAQGDDDG